MRIKSSEVKGRGQSKVSLVLGREHFSPGNRLLLVGVNAGSEKPMHLERVSNLHLVKYTGAQQLHEPTPFCHPRTLRKSKIKNSLFPSFLDELFSVILIHKS